MKPLAWNRFFKLLGAIVVLGLALPAEAAASTDKKTKRFALIVANNDSVDPDVESLEYADDDGARYYELFRSFADEATLLTTLDKESQRIFPKVARRTLPPSRNQLERAVGKLAKKIEKAREKGMEAELYLVFTGHGNVDEHGEGYLSLMDSKLRRSDLYREIIRPVDADFTHLIVDACHAYFMVHSRGGSGENWEDDRSGETLNEQLAAYLADRKSDRGDSRRTVGVIVSTAGTAEVHEWSRYRAGVFSHELRSGLLGAADANSDGDVTYPELEAYLVAANSAVTNPRARINVYAHPPKQDQARALTSLDRFRETTILEIPEGLGGRYYVEDSRGLRYADFNIDGSTPTRLALLHQPLDDGAYYLVTEKEQARISLDKLAVRSSELAFNDVTQRSRGAVDEAFRSELFKTSFGPSFVAGFRAGRSSEQARARSRAKTRKERTPESWRLEASLGYGLGPALPLVRGTDADESVEHRADLSATFRHESGWGLGPFLDYGGSALTEGSQHRIAGGIEGSYQIGVVSGLSLTPTLRAGHTAYLLNVDQLRSDPVGFHAAASIGVDWQLTRRLALFAEPGLSANLFTIDKRDPNVPNDERWYLQPTGRIGVTLFPGK